MSEINIINQREGINSNKLVGMAQNHYRGTVIKHKHYGFGVHGFIMKLDADRFLTVMYVNSRGFYDCKTHSTLKKAQDSF